MIVNNMLANFKEDLRKTIHELYDNVEYEIDPKDRKQLFVLYDLLSTNEYVVKAMSNNMKRKALKWNTERLDKAIDIFISKEGEYFSLLEKIYKDDKNFVPKVNTKSNNDIPKVKTRFHNINESFRNYPPDELERLLRESQKGKF